MLLETFPSPVPASFSDGRYTVKKFPGEGGKKKVYLARDIVLDCGKGTPKMLATINLLKSEYDIIIS
jgi:hypothetical protein